MPSFVLPVKILFQHCDPAGIVFYPRYFEMVNLVMETFFETEVGFSYAKMHQESRVGVPTVAIDATFTAPSRMGDVVAFAMTVDRVGRTSLSVTMVGTCAGEERLSVCKTITFIDKESGRPTPWLPEFRAVFLRFQRDTQPEVGKV
ncbi:MAG: thioesterase family protein [Pseudomonadota bacterium]